MEGHQRTSRKYSPRKIFSYPEPNHLNLIISCPLCYFYLNSSEAQNCF